MPKESAAYCVCPYIHLQVYISVVLQDTLLLQVGTWSYKQDTLLLQVGTWSYKQGALLLQVGTWSYKQDTLLCSATRYMSCTCMQSIIQNKVNQLHGKIISHISVTLLFLTIWSLFMLLQSLPCSFLLTCTFVIFKFKLLHPATGKCMSSNGDS